MEITNAKYIADPFSTGDNPRNICINCVCDGVLCSVPLAVGNRHYDEIMRQVDAGTLTIADAD